MDQVRILMSASQEGYRYNGIANVVAAFIGTNTQEQNLYISLTSHCTLATSKAPRNNMKYLRRYYKHHLCKW